MIVARMKLASIRNAKILALTPVQLVVNAVYRTTLQFANVLQTTLETLSKAAQESLNDLRLKMIHAIQIRVGEMQFARMVNVGAQMSCIRVIHT